MTQALSIRRRRLHWTLALVLVLILLAALLALAWLERASASNSSDESIKFNHKKHLAAEVPCLFCHPNALNGAVASLPSLNKCVGCHQNIEVTSAHLPWRAVPGKGQLDVDVLMAHWEEGEPLRWAKTYDQPDYVNFNHRPHIAAGVNCEDCHGDVSLMEVVRPAFRINMGFCLNCHNKQAAEKERLTSCATCHK
jgi:hypothetical protein